MKFSKKQAVAVAAGVAGLFSVGASNAADLTTTQAIVFAANVPNAFACPTSSGVCADFGNGYGNNAGVNGKTFSDFYTFSYTAAPNLGSASSTVQAFWTPLSGTPAPDVIFSAFSIYQDNGVIGDGGGDVLISTTLIQGMGESALTSALLNTGNYFIRIDGTINANPVQSNRGAYFGHAQITPVPEPGTYAMLLAGLGMMGFIARRRTRNLSSFA